MKIALYIEIVEVMFPRTRERRKIYLLDSNYSGKTYVEHVDKLNGLPHNELIKTLIEMSEHDGFVKSNDSWFPDCVLNCVRFGQKIKFEEKIYSLGEIYDIGVQTNNA